MRVLLEELKEFATAAPPAHDRFVQDGSKLRRWIVSVAKKIVLKFIARGGYVVLKQANFTNLLQRNAELDSALRSVHNEALQKRQESNRDMRIVLEANGRELERARAQAWEALDESRRFESRLADALDEIRRLKIRLEETPEIDYQVLMKQQDENAKFRDADAPFMALYERVKQFSMTSLERLYAMYKATEYVCKGGIPGSIVECGVWRGGSMMMAALTLQALGDTSRRLLLFDTVEGLPKPNPTEDVDLWGHCAYNEWTRRRLTDESSDWAHASIEEVRENLGSTGYPPEKLEFIKGMVQNTLPRTSPETIALLRLDTDWYESTVCELNHLYPHLSDGGVLIVDDYGHMRGQRKAVDEYFSSHNEVVLLNRVDYSGRVAIKLPRRPLA